MSGGGNYQVMDQTASFQISDKSKFRELDDEYLQRQARIWLGKVLKRRLDDEKDVPDILSSGDLLFDVACVFWRMLIEKDVKLDDLGIFRRTRKSKKQSGKYTPYSNVDAFLKICKIMGLNGIDLFSPSDAVERRDIRKVCLCIRSLSKKARSMDINVPDFDIVNYTVTMPTNLIGCVRRGLELSQCGLLSPDSYKSCIDSELSDIKTKSTLSLESSYDLRSDESEDASSSLSVGSYKPSSKMHLNTGFLRKSDSSSSLESFSLSKNNNLKEALVHFGICNNDMHIHEYIASPIVNSRGSLTENYHNDDAIVLSNGVCDMSFCSSIAGLDLDESFLRQPNTKDSSPVSNLQCHGYRFSYGEEQRKYVSISSEEPSSLQMHGEGLLCYNISCPDNFCNQPKNLLDIDDYICCEDDLGPVESQFGAICEPIPNPVHRCGKVHSNSCDMRRDMVVYSDLLGPEMNWVEIDNNVSCPDYQCYAGGSKDHLSSHTTSEYGDGEAESLYKVEDWPADNEDLEIVHLSIIERFLTTTICSEPKQSFYIEKFDESDCWNLDVDVSDVDLKPISTCEQFLHSVDGSSCDTNFVENLSLVGVEEDNGLIKFSSCQHQANDVECTKQITHGNDSIYEQEACKVLIQCFTSDRELDPTKSPLNHAPLETFDVDQDVAECQKAISIETDMLELEDHAVGKLNQSKTSKSPILKSIMGGAAVLGVLAFFFSTRIAEKPKSKKLDLEPSNISRENKLSLPTTNNGVAKKGVYAAGKLKFS